MSKGGAKAAASNYGVDKSVGEGYNSSAAGISSTELPFLQNELTNPQGVGQEDLSKMQTQGGQAVAGAVGAGDEAARLNASRTGNTAAVPGVIDNTARTAMQQQSKNVIGTDLANDQLKQEQQQEGSAGLEKMYGTDVSAALNALGLSNQAIGDWTNAKTAANNNLQGWTTIGLNELGQSNPAAALGQG